MTIKKMITPKKARQQPLEESNHSRRHFLKQAFVSTSALAFSSVANTSHLTFCPDYGRLSLKHDETTGLPLIQLPRDFRYKSFGWAGDKMRNGVETPGRHDGMAVVAVKGRRIVLVRNHELSHPNLTEHLFAEPTYDPLACGGTTNLLFDAKAGEWITSWGSLNGTFVNCAGGPTPWQTWLSCEETIIGPDTVTASDLQALAEQTGEPLERFEPLVSRLKTHGWVFEVPGFGRATARPLKPLGRFKHEAVAVDPVTGTVYQTEDARPSGFYRFVPNRFGQLEQGGKLQMLKVVSKPEFNFGGKIIDTDSEGDLKYEFPSFPVGSRWDVEWVTIDNPEVDFSSSDSSKNTPVFMQGYRQGGASFSRGEGCWHDAGKIYFTSTDGGIKRRGQVYQYDIARSELSLIFESPGADVLDRPDNITVSPRGGIVLCEDGGENLKMRGLTRDGSIFPFAQNSIQLTEDDIKKSGKLIPAGDYTASEWAGATFFGPWLFANIQTPGVTFAITGPWWRGSL